MNIPIYKADQIGREEILKRSFAANEAAERAAAEILLQVKTRGDQAIYALEEKFAGVLLSSLEVSEEEWEEGAKKADPALVQVLTEAAERIRFYHSHQKRNGFVTESGDGVILGQKITPLEKVGLYVPGGTARYPSSVLMNTIPAVIAGVEERIMVTPPDKDGSLPPALLAAAKIAGVTRIFKMGGAQAVAALAYGTESVPKVDKIVGPGNVFVAAAKKQVYGLVDIDMVAGPSEILVVADGGADPAVVAADLLSQAEHDKNATAVLITDCEKLLLQVKEQLEIQTKLLPREEICAASLEANGKLILVSSLSEALEISNALAPEHLELSVAEPFALLPLVKHAGSIFLGYHTPEALGDYFAGTNHTLPTSGTARFSSPLSVDDFIKKSSFCYYSSSAAAAAAEKVNLFANAEGLKAHGESMLRRAKKERI